MLRFMLCVSCCSAPPPRSAKRRASSHTQPKGAGSGGISKQSLNDREAASDGQEAKLSGPTGSSEKDRLLSNQIQANNEQYGANSGGDSQGKLKLPLGEQGRTPVALAASKVDQFHTRPTSSPNFRTDDAFDFGKMNSDEIESLRNLESEYNSARNGGAQSDSSPSSIDIDPFTESTSVNASHKNDQRHELTTADLSSETGRQQLEQHQQQLERDQYEDEIERVAYIYGEARDSLESSQARQSSKSYEVLASAAQNVPSITKIGDYARIEYSPVEDLDSVTTTSYSRFGSEQGGSRSQAGSSLGRHTSIRLTTNERRSVSRRSSQGGVESTSISIASQLSNEQLQHNLTNMLESVNSNYPIDMIGLPLGPPIGGAETTKTSPETSGAALTSASQDSLSDVVFEEFNTAPARPKTFKSNTYVGAALVVDSMDRPNMSDELLSSTQSAPLALAEDDDPRPATRIVNEVSNSESKSSGRVGSPQSIATTTSGALTNPTPTPSEMSTGSGKKRRIKAKALFKKLRPGSKKNNEPK